MSRTLPPVIWLTGNCGAGKTTLAYGAQRWLREHASSSRHDGVVVLDGDEMRASISTTEGLSPADRRAHNLRVARLAKVLQAQGLLVIVAVIAPFRAVREEIDALCSPRWVYLKREGLSAPDRPYEVPESPSYTMDIDAGSIEANVESLAAFIDTLQRVHEHARTIAARRS